MAARENDIGVKRCPLCGGAAALRLSANGYAYLAMDCCKGQLFARGGDSDEYLRALPDAVKAPRPAAAVAEPKPAPEPVPTPEPAPKAPAPPPITPKAPEPAQAKPRARMGWGLFPNS